MPSFPNKAAARAWCADSSTDHYFITLVEPANPHLRINQDNPARLRWGFVADYDSAKLVGVPTADLVDQIRERAAKHQASHLPQWICRTMSGKARAVWLFETAVNADHEALHDAFVAEFVKRVCVDKLLVGGRDQTSDNANQLMELGHGWEPIDANPVPTRVLEAIFYDATSKVSIRANEMTEIPHDVIAREVDKQFPGRWVGSFEVGSRGPLFWINDGIDRVGCMIGNYGVVCFSDRAGKGFVSWKEILGHKFCEDFENLRVESLTSNFWYDGSKYHQYDPDSKKCILLPKDDMRLKLRVMGCSDAVGKKVTFSECDKVLEFINTQHRVNIAAPLVHFKPGPVMLDGEQCFNTLYKRVVQPAADGDPSLWPWTHRLLTNLLDSTHTENGHGPTEHLFAWMKRLYEAGLNHTPMQGHALIIAGEAGQGKTFLGSVVLAALMGGAEDTSRLLSGSTAFNEAQSKVAIWTVDDTTTADDYTRRKLFGELLKQHVANPFIEHHAKYGTARRVPWHGRIVITCNQDSESLDVIPALDNSIKDKLMLFKTSSYRHDFADNDTNHKTVVKELPHLARWLLDWDPPAELVGEPRFGVRPYHHPFVTKAASEASPEHTFTEVLDIWRKAYTDFNGEKKWEGTATELLRELIDCGHTKELVRGVTSIKLGRILGKLHGGYEPIKEANRLNGRTTYTIDWS